MYSYCTDRERGISAFLLNSILLGFSSGIALIALQLSGNNHYLHIGKHFVHVFSISPHICLTYCLVQFSRLAVRNHNWKVMTPENQKLQCHFERNPCCEGNKSLPNW